MALTQKTGMAGLRLAATILEAIFRQVIRLPYGTGIKDAYLKRQPETVTNTCKAVEKHYFGWQRIRSGQRLLAEWRPWHKLSFLGCS